jgi:hypothetical protein
VSAVDRADRHAEAHRLRTERGWGRRRIAAELGITPYAAQQLLDQPPPARAAASTGPVDRPAAPPAGGRPVDDQRAPASPASPAPVVSGRPVGDRTAAIVPLPAVRAAAGRPAEGRVGEVDDQAAAAGRPGAPGGPWLRLDLGARPGLLRAVTRMVRLGLHLPAVADVALRAFAAAYHEAIRYGRLAPGQPYEVRTVVRPCAHPPA